MQTAERRRRSVAYLDHDGERWGCFLVTFQGDDGMWRGFFSFRSERGEAEGAELRTADIFLEADEASVHEKARGLGRPLLASLLASVLHAQPAPPAAPEPRPGRLAGWFRTILGPGEERDGPPAQVAPTEPDDLRRLRSLYASYRLDQVCHLIALVEPEAFAEAVRDLLDGRSIDFRASDRLQLAMIVVDHLERLLPLPPFEVWVEDYLAAPAAYRLYAHALHRGNELP